MAALTGMPCRVSTSPAWLQVVLAIKDSGCGIPSDKLDAIFEPFNQVGGWGQAGQPLTSASVGTALHGPCASCQLAGTEG